MSTLSLRLGLDALQANPLRTLLSTLGVIMGVGSMVSVLSIGDGVEVMARTEVARTTSLQVVSLTPKVVQELDGVLVARRDVVAFRPADVASLRATLPAGSVVALVGMRGAPAQLGTAGRVRGVRLVEGTPAAIQAGGARVAVGAAFTEADVAAARPLAVLSASAADSLGGRGAGSHGGKSLVGATILLAGRPFTVSGVLAPRRGDRAEVLVPFGAAPPLPDSPLGPRPAMVLALAPTVEAVPAMKRGVQRWLSGRYGPRWTEAVDLSADTDRLEQVSRGLLVYRLLMGSITGVALLVGGIGIMNVLLASVTERTREIGIRKATGARNRDILAQFLAESVVITGAGALLGVGLGLTVAATAAAVMRARAGASVHAALSPTTILVAAAASITVGLVFGLYPALRAARLSPIEAIRHE